MEFGRIPNPGQIDWRLPPDPARNLFVLGERPEPSRRLWVGTVGWGYREWVGSVYPRKTPVHDYLKAYSRRFRSVELNASFYRTPQIEQAQAWAAATPEDFRFCPKVTQTLSHVRPVGASEAQTEEFVSSMEAFGSRLGMSFLQLPPDFTRRRENEVREFLSRVAPRVPCGVEFRHESFFDRQGLRSDVRAWLENAGAAAVITDTGGRRDVLHADLTAKRSLIRFLGNEDPLSDVSRIEDWSHKIARWFDQGLEELYFFVHQPDNVKAPELLETTLRIFAERTGLEVYPRDRVEPEPEPESPQVSLF